MLKGNSAGIIFPIIVFICSCVAFFLTLKSARLLKYLFSARRFQPINSFEVQVRPRHSLKLICKRVIPVYGIYSYNSVQYDMPPVGHIFELCVYLLFVWGINYYIVVLNNNPVYGYCILTGIFATAVSVWLCLALHDSFVRSFNHKEYCKEVKIGDNSTMLDIKIRENKENDEFRHKNLIISLTVSIMIGLGTCFLSFFNSSIAESELGIFVLIQSCINCLLDLPSRVLLSKILQKVQLCHIYELEYSPLLIDLNARDISKFKISEPCIEDRIDSYPNNEFSIPLDYSANFSPIRARQVEGLCEIMKVGVSHNLESEPERENIERVSSNRSVDTVASHNAASEDENIQNTLTFSNTPKAKSPIKSLYASPAKYFSPVKNNKNKTEVFIKLHQVSIDNSDNSDDIHNVSGGHNDSIGLLDNFEEHKNEDNELYQDFYSALRLDSENPIETVIFEKNKTQEYENIPISVPKIITDNIKIDTNLSIGSNTDRNIKSNSSSNTSRNSKIPEKPNLNIEPDENIKIDTDKSIKPDTDRSSSMNINAGTLDKNPKIDVDIKIYTDQDLSYDKLIINQSPICSAESNGSGHIVFDIETPDVKQQSKPLFTLPNLGRNPIKLNPVPPSQPKNSEKPAKNLKNMISLHRKTLSFEEDCKSTPRSQKDLGSPIKDISGLEFIPNPTLVWDQSSEKNFSEQKVSKENGFKEFINLKSKLGDYVNENTSSSELMSDEISSEFDESNELDESIKDRQGFSEKISKSKNILGDSGHNSGARKLVFGPEEGKNKEPEENKHRSKSQNNKKNTKPPSRPRPSKSTEKERDVATSGEYSRKNNLDISFLKKNENEKDLVRDKTVFKKKSNKKIMKHIDKILETKENDSNDPQIIKLKSMLASRQSFKKKHVDLPKDNPYNQRISTLLSDGSTPNEEFRIDPATLKIREERLKRISSIYSTRKNKKSLSKSKSKNSDTLSPSKSENVIKRKNPDL